MNDYRDQMREERRERARARWERKFEDHQNGHGHIWMGLLLLIIGGVALAKSFGVPMPVWLFSWQMLLIAIGVFVGLKRGFRNGGWFVPIIIGGAFLANDFFLDGDLRRHMWPLIIIVFGILFILRPRRRNWNPSEKRNAGKSAETIQPISEEHYSQDDFINSTCIFSGAKRVILSKNFKGGDMVNIFGGCEVDLTQADMNAPAEIEVTAIFGGATLIIPSNWAVKSEVVTIFGGISDKRNVGVLTEPTSKTLILKGTLIFGGMEIKSY